MARTLVSHEVVRGLRADILNGRFRGAIRLPSEPALASLYGVSRATLREALRVLETEGVIRPHQGKGTFIALKAGVVLAGIERLQSFTETIRAAGHEARDEVLEIREVKVAEAIANLLGRTRGQAGVLIRSLRYVDNMPAIYCEDTIPLDLLDDPGLIVHRRLRESLLDFFVRDLKVDVSYAVLFIEAVRARGEAKKALHVSHSTPLILLQGTACDKNDRPIYASLNYVRSDAYRFVLIRR